jgi:integrase
LIESDKTPKFADLARRRLRKLFKIAKASSLREITLEGVQSALAQLRAEGRGLKTLNHYGDTAKMFLDWCIDADRLVRNPLAKLGRYKAKTDPRHERRSISLEEFYRLLEAAKTGRRYARITGPERDLCYRLTVTCGLRYGEVKALRPEWFDWQALTLTIPAKFSKNRKLASLPIDGALADHLKTHIATLEQPDGPVFPMPKRGSSMIRLDLAKAGIPYKLSNKIFDFHALRGMTATILDEIGTPSGVRRDLMRHATESMTAIYTRPREDQHRQAIDRLAAALVPVRRATKGATSGNYDGEQNDANSDRQGGSDDDIDGWSEGAIPAASTTYVN